MRINRVCLFGVFLVSEKEFICLQIKMFMSPSHAMIYVSLLRGALITSHAFTFNIGNRQGRTVSRVQFDTK